jgi:hypothetical protein
LSAEIEDPSQPEAGVPKPVTAFGPALRRRWWWRWSVRLAILASVLLAAFFYQLYRADARLLQLEAQLDRDDPGWRLDDIEAGRAQIPAAENSALVVAAASALFPRNGLPGEVTNPFADLPANAPIGSDDYARLSNELSEWELALAEARNLTDMPRGRHRIVWTRPNLIASGLPTQQTSREVAQLLRLAALRRVEDGDCDGALADCRAAVSAGRSIGDEPLAISALVRTACVATACATAERVLAQGDPSAAELAALQELLEDEDAFPQLRVAMRGERAWMHEVISEIEMGAIPISSLTLASKPPQALERLIGSLLRPSFKSEHSSILALLTRYVDSTSLPAREQLAVDDAIRTEVASAPRTAILTHMLVPALCKVTQSFHRKHAQVRTLIAGLAAERYRRAHGAWPESLADLTPGELTAVPRDPFDDEPLRLLHLPDGIEIYSVGVDAIDNNGRLAVGAQVNQPGFDIGIRLWDPVKRPRATHTESGARR